MAARRRQCRNETMSPPVIQLRELVRTYKSGEVQVKAVRGVTLDIHRGEFVAIMGSSGSGKSTLMNTIGCLDQPTSGTYLLDGVAVADLDRKPLAKLRNKKLGFVFQSFHLLARTSAQENVELPLFYRHPLVALGDRHDRSVKALEKVGLGQRRDHFSSQLSGGQQQRVAIARALVSQPEVLLADEPTGNLDTRTSIEIMGLFQELNDSDITIVMVTHNPDLTSYASRIIQMRDGRIARDSARKKAPERKARKRELNSYMQAAIETAYGEGPA